MVGLVMRLHVRVRDPQSFLAYEGLCLCWEDSVNRRQRVLRVSWNFLTLSKCERDSESSWHLNSSFVSRTHLAHVPFYCIPYVRDPVEFVPVLFLGFKVFRVLFGIVFFHNLKPVARLSNPIRSVFFVPGAKDGSIRNSDLPTGTC